MMKISTSQILRPFSHLTGTLVFLPGSFLQIEIFPCLLRIYSLKDKTPALIQEIHIQLKGPIHEFTIWNDLESGKITVRGRSQEGWFRYHLMSSCDGNEVGLIIDRAPLEGIKVIKNSLESFLKNNEKFNLISENSLFIPYVIPQVEKLFFGNHKAQDIELLRRRLDLTEIFPIWHRLGQMIPKLPLRQNNDEYGMFSLLKKCRDHILQNKPEKGRQDWLNLFQAGFNGIFVPRLEDDGHWGLIENSIKIQEDSPLQVLLESSELIRQLFINQENNQLLILPHLLPELHCGHLLNADLNGIGKVSLEWSKKTIRRLALHSKKDQALEIIFRSNVRSYRLRTSNKDSGKRISTRTPLQLKQNIDYFFDNFM